MANTIRLKRRAAGGSAGAPASLATSEVAYNEQDDIVYIGFGDNGSGVATSIKAIAGVGAFVALTGAQTVAGVKTFSSFPVTPSSAPTTDYQVANKKFVLDSMAGAGAGDMVKATYDPTSKNGDAFSQDNMVDGTTNKNYSATDKTKLAGIEAAADVTDAGNVGTAINGATAKTTPVSADKIAIIDSAASNVLKYTTYANFLATIQTAIVAAIVASAPGTLDTLDELAAALGDDANYAATITTALGLKAPLASPVFTGNPTAPTPTAGDNDTSIATTAFVNTAIFSTTIDGGTF